LKVIAEFVLTAFKNALAEFDKLGRIGQLAKTNAGNIAIEYFGH
jgi:hypothetical protein